MKNIATHPGPFVAVAQGSVRVKIETLSACSSCQAHSRCGFAEKKEQELSIDNADWQQYAVGDSVQVVISESRGMQAVLLAYIIPSILLLGGLILLLQWLSELVAVMAVLLLIAAYYLVLYACRQRLQNKFTFQITKE